MNQVFIIRHGETEHNKAGEITGQEDVSLNNTGIKQAEKLAERLEKEDFDAAYSSDLERTYETTRIVAEKQGLAPERYKEFREMDFGVFEGEPKSSWGDYVSQSDVGRHLVRAEEGETIEEVGERFVGKLNTLRERHSEDKILVGGHSVAIKASIMNILNLEGDEYKKLDLDNTSITVLEYSEEYGWIMQRINDSAHLES